MKKITTLFLCLCCYAAVHAQDINGNWQGSVDAGGQKLRIIFHITKNAAGYEGSFDSPDQQAFGLKLSSINLSADSLHIGMALIHGGYHGKWDGKNQVSGNLLQGPATLPLLLNRINDAQQPKNTITQVKPQTPQPPFPYSTEEVSYRNEQENIVLTGTLSKPASGDRFPVVLLISGSGPQDRDETIGMHKPFALIADRLTKAGIAVLRVDDRGVGKSTGNFAAASSENFANDVLTGIAYLKTRKDIDEKKIGLIGHSEGAMIAPYVAARSADVAYLVLLAGPVVGGKATMYFQAVEKPLGQLSKASRDAYGKLYTSMYAFTSDTTAALHPENFVRQTYLRWKQDTPDSIRSQIIKGSDEQMIQVMTKQFPVFGQSWWKFFLNHDPAKDLEKIQVPLLALHGEKDEQVDPKANLALIREIRTKNGNRTIKTVEIPGLNHLFQHCKQCGSVQEYLSLEETFDPATLTLLTEWIVSTTQPNPLIHPLNH